MGRYTVHLVGESNYQDAVRRLRPGDPVDLRHDADNRHDRRAIVARDFRGATVGYTERGSWIGRAIIDEGSTIAATVSAIIGGERGKPSLGVVLEVRTAHDLDGAPQMLPPPAAQGRDAPQRVKVETSRLTWVGVVALVLLVATCAWSPG